MSSHPPWLWSTWVSGAVAREGAHHFSVGTSMVPKCVLVQNKEGFSDLSLPLPLPPNQVRTTFFQSSGGLGGFSTRCQLAWA